MNIWKSPFSVSGCWLIAAVAVGHGQSPEAWFDQDLEQWEKPGPQLTGSSVVRTFEDPEAAETEHRFIRAREEPGRAEHPFPGVQFVAKELSSPRNQVHVAYIALDEPGIRVDATAPDTSISSTDAWGEQTGALLAVNGDFFAWRDGTTFVYGDAVGGGERWPYRRSARIGNTDHSGAWYYGNYGWIAFGDYGVEFSNTQHVKNNRDEYGAHSGWRPEEVTGEIPEGTHALVSGFSQLVIEGEPVVCADPTSDCFSDRGDMHDRHPRTAMGLTEDKETLILVVVDGRSSNSAGMYGTELAELMHDLGAWVAFNLDGGGSSTMWIRDRGIVNQPSGGAPRSTPNHWGVFPAED